MKRLEELLMERNEIINKLKKGGLSKSIEEINKMLLKLINIRIKLEQEKNKE